MQGRSAADAAKVVLSALLRRKTRPKAGGEASVAVRLVIVTPPWPAPEPARTTPPAGAGAVDKGGSGSAGVAAGSPQSGGGGGAGGMACLSRKVS